jgi:hypothetical protein
MAEIPQFDAKAPRKRPPMVPTDSGAPQALASLANAASQLTAQIGQMADRAAIREEADEATRDQLAMKMPGTDFAYTGASAATSVTSASGAPLTGALADQERYIREAAAKRGIDPDIAVKVARSEGLAPGVWQSTVVKNGKRERSYGPFQLYIDGGLGNEFMALTGKSPADPSTVYQQIDFALDRAVELGWSPWYGAAKVGVGARDGLANARAAGVRETTPAAAATPQGGVSVQLTGAVSPLRLKKPGTLRGDAYNRAATDLYLNRLDTAMRLQMEALALQHDGDPASLDAALETLRAGYLQDQPAAAAVEIERSFETTKFGLQRQAIRDFRQDLESRNLAAFEENINRRITDALRIASKGGYDADADRSLVGELAGIDAQIDASPMTPLQKSRMRASAAQDVWSARILGGFDDIEDPAARAAFANQLETEWQNGEGLGGRLDQRSFDQVRGEIARRLQADEAAAAKRAAALDKAVDSQISFLKKGFPVPAGERERLRQEIAKTNDPALAANLDFLDGLADWQKAHVAARPQVLAAQIAAMRTRIAEEGITPAAETTLDVMESLAEEMQKGLSTDPLGWASRAGVATIEPLDFTDASTLSASLSERTADAAAVAAHYGIAPKFFTPAEADGLKKMLKAAPLALPSIVSGLSAGLGSDTPRALAELTDDAPVLAHVAGLVHATGDQRVAVEVAEALALRAEPGYKSALPSAAKLVAATAAALDGAIGADPTAASEITETAAALFEARALTRGIDMAEFDTDGSPAREAYLSALDQVLGATTRDGVKFGGLTEVNGFTTIAPADIAADAMQDLLDGLTAEDLAKQMPIQSLNGLPITPARIRSGRLMRVSDGRYRVALGDVAAGDPKYVASPDGGYFELDIKTLRRSQFARRVSGAIMDRLR